MRRHALAALCLFAAALPSRTLAATCSVSATGTAFGSYDTLSLLDSDSTGTITVSCTTGIALLFGYDIKLSAGSAGSYSPRKLASGGNTLNYNLYTSVLRTTIWGDGTGGSSIVSDSFLLSIGTTNKNYTVYGRIPARQNAASGGYADTITVSVIY